MKKLMILTATLLTGGLALPAAAQSHRGHSQSSGSEIYISGHLPCGAPIYSKQVRHGQHYHSQRVSGYELRRHLDRQRRIAAQRELERRLVHSRYSRSRSGYTRNRRCR